MLQRPPAQARWMRCSPKSRAGLGLSLPTGPPEPSRNPGMPLAPYVPADRVHREDRPSRKAGRQMSLEQGRTAGADSQARTGLILSALAVLLVARGSERLARWLIDLDDDL